ncbi:coatomer subunit zeta-2 isoform X2 [Rhinichthys klamathensis goyatoka]|uniref:coatomer subunit zeta-2 isoform X2 n=1 Tax=Rhinichthys klamathensis goyatoka TaxID=3034132 RepID=UPI0024B4FBEA|nr:coatomer subunit zeta-2 isoform X2 [Rhinichthys klamathensis goyatoka]
MTAQSCPRQHCAATTMDSTALEPSLYTVKAVFILDNDGNRLLSKYYDLELYPSMKEQKNFEMNVFNKTHKADNEIAFLEGMTIVYKSSIDLFFYVVGSAQENELMLMAVLNCLFESLNQMLRKNVEKRTLLDNMDGVFLVVDEIIDGGVILESDPQQVLEKVNYRCVSEQAYGFVLFDYITGNVEGQGERRELL